MDNGEMQGGGAAHACCARASTWTATLKAFRHGLVIAEHAGHVTTSTMVLRTAWVTLVAEMPLSGYSPMCEIGFSRSVV